MTDEAKPVSAEDRNATMTSALPGHSAAPFPGAAAPVNNQSGSPGRRALRGVVRACAMFSGAYFCQQIFIIALGPYLLDHGVAKDWVYTASIVPGIVFAVLMYFKKI